MLDHERRLGLHGARGQRNGGSFTANRFAMALPKPRLLPVTKGDLAGCGQ